MFDLPQNTAETRPMQRAKGKAHVAFEGGRLTHLSQAGCAKIMLPRSHTPHPEGIFLNTSGGLTGGDHITLSGAVASGTLCLTTQTAERAYASTGAAARLDITLSVGEGATLLWLPQETILFDRSHLRRRTRIDAAPGARVLALEMLVFGRAAMGEDLADFQLQDRREIWRGEPVWVDALALDERLLKAAAGLGGARAIATLIYMGDDAQDRLRALDLSDGVAASAWNDRLVIRAAGADLWPLKQQLAPLITQLSGVPLPRVWAV